MLKRCIGLLMLGGLLALFAVGCGQSGTSAGSGSQQGAQVQEQKPAAKKVLKLSSVLPEGHPTHEAMVFFANQVKDKTKGEIEIQVFPNSQLGEQRDALEGMKVGTLEMAMVAAGPLGQFVPTVDVLNLPYIFRDLDHLHKALDGDPGKKLSGDIQKAGYEFLFWMDSGSRNVINNKRPIYKPEDLKGLKIRVMTNKLMVDTLNRMGAIATPMGQGEVYSALQQGVIDGWENNPPTLLTLKLYEVSKYFSWTRHFIIPDVVLMSKKVFDGLTPEQQKAVKEAASEAMAKQRELWANFETKSVEELKQKGIQFNDVPDITPFVERVKPVWETYTSKFGTELVEAIQKVK
ncbi:MAG: TRAP transporter substrate-binding protein [Moorellaceae bacterium]